MKNKSTNGEVIKYSAVEAKIAADFGNIFTF